MPDIISQCMPAVQNLFILPHAARKVMAAAVLSFCMTIVPSPIGIVVLVGLPSTMKAHPARPGVYGLRSLMTLPQDECTGKIASPSVDSAASSYEVKETCAATAAGSERNITVLFWNRESFPISHLILKQNT